MRNQYRCDSIEELRAAFDEIKSTVAGDTLFMAQALMFLAEQNVTVKVKKKPSEWQKFLSREMKAGLSIQQAAANWRQRKAK